MTLNSGNVRTGGGKASRVLFGDDTAPAPTSADMAVAVGGDGWDDCGYVSDGGVTRPWTQNTQSIMGWQGGDELLVVVTDANVRFNAVLLEERLAVVEKYYATKVQSDGSFILVPSRTGGRHKLIVDVATQQGVYERQYAAAAAIIGRGDQAYVNGQPIGYNVTIAPFPHPSMEDPEDGQVGVLKIWKSSLTPAAAVQVTSITPGVGDIAGGDTIAIAGSGLTGSTGVDFGADAGTGLSVIHDGLLTVTTPAVGAAGVVDVTVYNPSGDVTVSAGFEFTGT